MGVGPSVDSPIWQTCVGSEFDCLQSEVQERASVAVPIVTSCSSLTLGEAQLTDVVQRQTLLMAAADGHHVLLKTMLRRGADVNTRLPMRLEMNSLLDKQVGGEVMSEGSKGQGAEDDLIACHFFNKQAERRSGAQVGLTPLMHACKNKHLRCVKAILEAAADVNVEDEEGVTALHFAAATGDIDIVRAVMAHNADPSIEDCHGLRPMDYAQEEIHEHAAVVQNLIRAMDVSSLRAEVL
eukprot:TRINITY_DN23212_c0_g1_i3.p2 TRINITY_DN23212_c0_g1~~TRINITY_DN23212_c0_g1_i3.p2  ORF type:complete len:239 (-),score=63.58 TRINITY_DN23212_c0_g1_i3:86-802(-)